MKYERRAQEWELRCSWRLSFENSKKPSYQNWNSRSEGVVSASRWECSIASPPPSCLTVGLTDAMQLVGFSCEQVKRQRQPIYPWPSAKPSDQLRAALLGFSANHRAEHCFSLILRALYNPISSTSLRLFIQGWNVTFFFPRTLSCLTIELPSQSVVTFGAFLSKELSFSCSQLADPIKMTPNFLSRDLIFLLG